MTTKKRGNIMRKTIKKKSVVKLRPLFVEGDVAQAADVETAQK